MTSEENKSHQDNCEEMTSAEYAKFLRDEELRAQWQEEMRQDAFGNKFD